MDILYAVLCWHTCPDRSGRREDPSKAEPSGCFRLAVAMLLIGLLAGSADFAARRDGVDVAAATVYHSSAKGN
jgi:hypothetical protein